MPQNRTDRDGRRECSRNGFPGSAARRRSGDKRTGRPRGWTGFPGSGRRKAGLYAGGPDRAERHPGSAGLPRDGDGVPDPRRGQHQRQLLLDEGRRAGELLRQHHHLRRMGRRGAHDRGVSGRMVQGTGLRGPSGGAGDRDAVALPLYGGRRPGTGRSLLLPDGLSAGIRDGGPADHRLGRGNRHDPCERDHDRRNGGGSALRQPDHRGQGDP